MKKIFLATPKNITKNKCEEYRAQVKVIFPEHDVVLGLEDWLDWFDGDWEEWIRSINRLDYYTRLPRYEMIVCPVNPIGHATAQIVGQALQLKKPVKHWDGKNCHSISNVSAIDKENWQSGWKLIPQGE